MCGGSQGKAAGRRQSDRIQEAQDERQASRPQPFLHGPQRICRIGRLDNDETVGGEAEPSQPGAIEPAKLVGEGGRPAAQDASRPPIGYAAADAEGYREDKGCSPGCRPARAALSCRRLHLVDAAGLQAFRAEQRIDLGGAEAPGWASLLIFRPLRRLAVSAARQHRTRHRAGVTLDPAYAHPQVIKHAPPQARGGGLRQITRAAIPLRPRQAAGRRL